MIASKLHFNTTNIYDFIKQGQMLSIISQMIKENLLQGTYEACIIQVFVATYHKLYLSCTRYLFKFFKDD